MYHSKRANDIRTGKNKSQRAAENKRLDEEKAPKIIKAPKKKK